MSWLGDSLSIILSTQVSGKITITDPDNEREEMDDDLARHLGGRPDSSLNSSSAPIPSVFHPHDASAYTGHSLEPSQDP